MGFPSAVKKDKFEKKNGFEFKVQNEGKKIEGALFFLIPKSPLCPIMLFSLNCLLCTQARFLELRVRYNIKKWPLEDSHI